MITANNMTTPWKKYGDIMQEGIKYIEERATGHVKSLKTEWNAFNSIGMNGIEWKSLLVISSRPGVGKTLIGSALARQVQRLNETQDFNVLNFQFEMIGKNIASRELSAMTKLPLRYILSAQDKGMGALSTTDLGILRDYASKQNERKEFVVDTPMTVEQMRNTVAQFYTATRKPFLITLDHTLLVKQAASETSRTVTLQNLATMLVETKNKYPVSWIILTQLNREIDDAERQKPGQLSNYPGEADVYGSDFLLQCADVMIAYNRPAKYNLSLYGPLKYVITPEYKNLLAAHVLKNRYGDVSIQWYMADYQTMNLYETVAPQRKI